jgi:hypothetical protein
MTLLKLDCQLLLDTYYGLNVQGQDASEVSGVNDPVGRGHSCARMSTPGLSHSGERRKPVMSAIYWMGAFAG